VIAIAVPCAGHGLVDLAVRFVGPEFVAAGSAASFDVVVDTLAYDSAYGATLTITVNNARVTGSDPAWKCIAGPELIQCAAEELRAGPHPVHVEVQVPASGSTVRIRATVDALGSVDPQPENNKRIIES